VHQVGYYYKDSVCMFNFTFSLVYRHEFCDDVLRVAVVHIHRTMRQVYFLECETDSPIRAVPIRRIGKSLVSTPLFRFSGSMFLRFPLSEVGSMENCLWSFKSFHHSNECWFSHAGKHWDCSVMRCDAAWMRPHVSADGNPNSEQNR
jgi:hypothetical protein